MLLEVFISITILLFSVIFHELAHGYLADLQGDHTARFSGRLSLNPLQHLDLFGSVILPTLLFLSGTGVIFGWAKPVPVNERNFADPKKGLMLCAIAGPLANLTLAFIAGLFLKAGVEGLWGEIFYLLVRINFILAIFNLLPIPPMDGSRVVAYFLSGRAAYYYYQLERYGLLLIFLLLYFGFFSWVLSLFMPLLRFFY